MSDWRRCDAHPDVVGERMWGCPDCLFFAQRENAALRAKLAAAEEALREQREWPGTSHYEHFDKTGGGGSGCPACHAERDRRDAAAAALRALEGKDG